MQWVRKVAYKFKLPSELTSVHPLFHFSTLKKYIADPLSILPIEGLGINENLYYYKVLVEILDRQVKKLRNNELASVKVPWRKHIVEGTTWEAEADIIFPVSLSMCIIW